MDIVLRATVLFAIVYLLLRLLGKRELGQLSPFDVVMLVTMGDLIQQGVTHNDFSITGASLAIATFAFWSLVLGWITYLSPRLERMLDGEPRVIICDGRVLRENLRRDQLTLGEIESEMRLAGIASVQDVAWGIIEPNGKISFIGRDETGRHEQRDKAELV
jgi:uncharacterized membrane protein YcaP (DUF421 family)